MKTYHFAPISAREYPTTSILGHPFIWGGVQFSLNVSEKPYSREIEAAMNAHCIDWKYCPVSEDYGADWKESMEQGLQAVYTAYTEGKKIVVHCDCGNNRSRSFVEAFYFMLTGEEFQDEYKGEINHLVYNCKKHHLPELMETEKWIKSLLH